MKTLLKMTDQDITSHAGLILISPFLKSKEFRREITAVSQHVKSTGVISTADILICWIAILALGKSDYDAIKEYQNDKHFKNMTGVKHVPSPETLRQRIETMPYAVAAVLRNFSEMIIATGFERATQYSKRDNKYQEAVTIGDQAYAVIDSDVSVLDNSDTKKEGVEWTYKKCDGYAPMFSYIGASGYMLNNELREGSMHSNAEGTIDYFKETIAIARHITELSLLVVLDSGNDDKKLLDVFETESVSYVIKRNLRKESVQDWLELAKAHPTHQRTARDGSTVYYASAEREIVVEERRHKIRIAVVARERLWDKDQQMLLVPEISTETYWTNLPGTDQDIENIYHMHGTMEQYHAELKSDLGVERLPSGKFHANMLHLLCSMIAFNLLRLVGLTLLQSGKTPGKRGRRLRLRTVLQSVMYMAGTIIHHGGQVFLRIFSGHAWSAAVQWSYATYSSA
jgi:hypothetical protein